MDNNNLVVMVGCHHLVGGAGLSGGYTGTSRSGSLLDPGGGRGVA